MTIQTPNKLVFARLEQIAGNLTLMQTDDVRPAAHYADGHRARDARTTVNLRAVQPESMRVLAKAAIEFGTLSLTYNIWRVTADGRTELLGHPNRYVDYDKQAQFQELFDRWSEALRGAPAPEVVP